jgi:adenylyl-sulfate kinase
MTLRDVATPANTRADSNQRGAIFWLTGLSGSGKTTLATHADSYLRGIGYLVTRLDGDDLRRTISCDLGFSPQDRHEHARRAAHAAGQLAGAGQVVLVALISPFASDRAAARSVAPGLFHEIHVDASLQVCERRDPRHLYRRARHGDIPDFTGISSPYEAPASPDLRIETGVMDVASSVDRLVGYVMAQVPPPRSAARPVPLLGDRGAKA